MSTKVRYSPVDPAVSYLMESDVATALKYGTDEEVEQIRAAAEAILVANGKRPGTCGADFRVGDIVRFTIEEDEQGTGLVVSIGPVAGIDGPTERVQVRVGSGSVVPFRPAELTKDGR